MNQPAEPVDMAKVLSMSTPTASQLDTWDALLSGKDVKAHLRANYTRQVDGTRRYDGG